jgi:hypothetical protein
MNGSPTIYVKFVLFEFDNNDFWSSWANRFNLTRDGFSIFTAKIPAFFTN